MEDNKTAYEKGIVLLKSAIKKYEKGDYEHGDKDRGLANEFFDKVKKEDTYDDVALYGEGRNFGIIYNVFVENAKKIISENKNTKAIKEFITTIRKNKVLNEQFKIYDTFCNKIINCDSDTFINEAINILPYYKNKELVENNNKLIDIIRKNKLDEFIEITDEKINLYESIEYFITNKRTLDNIEAYNANKTVIKENLDNLVKENQNNKTITKDILDKEINETVNKYTELLNDDEMKLLSELCEGNKQEVFNRYKNDTIKFVSNQLSLAESTEDKIDWNNVLTKLNLKEYNEKTVLEDISSFINVQNIIAE